MYLFLDEPATQLTEISELKVVIQEKNKAVADLESELCEIRNELSIRSTTDFEMETPKLAEENENLRKSIEESDRKNQLLSSQLLEIQTKINDCEGELFQRESFVCNFLNHYVLCRSQKRGKGIAWDNLSFAKSGFSKSLFLQKN